MQDTVLAPTAYLGPYKNHMATVAGLLRFSFRVNWPQVDYLAPSLKFLSSARRFWARLREFFMQENRMFSGSSGRRIWLTQLGLVPRFLVGRWANYYAIVMTISAALIIAPYYMAHPRSPDSSIWEIFWDIIFSDKSSFPLSFIESFFLATLKTSDCAALGFYKTTGRVSWSRF